MKYYKDSLGYVGTYKDGVLNHGTFLSTEKLEDLVPASPDEIKKFLADKKKREERKKREKRELEQRVKEIKKVFGFDPREVGNRPRGFEIVESVEEEEHLAGAQVGDLCIETRDGASNPPDMKAGTFGNYLGTACNGFDSTYRYYYYRKEEK